MQIFSNIATFALLAHLLLATSGLPLAYHFCGGELESVSLGTVAAQACQCNHSASDDDESVCCDKDCCQNEITVSKLAIDGVLSSAFVAHAVFAAPFALLPAVSPTPPTLALSSSCDLFEHSPPRRSLDLPILFRSLLI